MLSDMVSSPSSVIRRFVALSNGVYFSYPGEMLAANFDSLGESWYRKALRHSGRVALTMRLDPGGAGHIVTISREEDVEPSYQLLHTPVISNLLLTFWHSYLKNAYLKKVNSVSLGGLRYLKPLSGINSSCLAFSKNGFQ
jgi:hypothetical protein